MGGKIQASEHQQGRLHFCHGPQVPMLMEKFEQGPLRDFTPCLFTDRKEIIHAVAVVHAELVLIHPFREGNGRLARMLAVLMGLQAGLPPFDFGGIKGRVKQKYFAAVQVGMEYNYAPMEKIFMTVLERTLRQG